MVEFKHLLIKRVSIVRKEKTFVIVVREQQHNTWQGTLSWVDKSRKSNFRSALELIRLMDEAVGSPKAEVSNLVVEQSEGSINEI